ncbi:class II fructose-bisphosphate aldolase [Ruminococcus sp. OA3]|uniref:class II fructose-bisphosphate aldolase n=1 Tax=Ruminococcus sp. OA3 TaxID=2914164 RepID=UPI001F0683BD|nr:class II fructose-bisphosphate aldolase [Ruminococcus sp. OA3]MCH1982420.1 class II fructose-bisphosphate aldolase [Ruminococcus sp. OA3]
MRWDRDYVKEAADSGRVIPGFNIFGYEDALAVTRAAEEAGCPVLLMVNRGAVDAMDAECWGKLLSSIAQRAAVPVGVHLDHCSDTDIIRRAVDSGFSSVMYDGSKLSFEKNREITQQMAEYAHACGVLLEAELGQVPYSDLGETEIRYTSPEEAAGISSETEADWLAVSVGNVHRLVDRTVTIDFSVLHQIQKVCRLPLVIHGSSGVSSGDIKRLKHEHIGKMNFGTVLRKAFSDALRMEMQEHPEEFDRLKLFAYPVTRVEQEAYQIISMLQGIPDLSRGKCGEGGKNENSAERTV